MAGIGTSHSLSVLPFNWSFTSWFNSGFIPDVKLGIATGCLALVASTSPNGKAVPALRKDNFVPSLASEDGQPKRDHLALRTVRQPHPKQWLEAISTSSAKIDLLNMRFDQPAARVQPMLPIKPMTAKIATRVTFPSSAVSQSRAVNVLGEVNIPNACAIEPMPATAKIDQRPSGCGMRICLNKKSQSS